MVGGYHCLLIFCDNLNITNAGHGNKDTTPRGIQTLKNV